jgi:hypothetical protein
MRGAQTAIEYALGFIVTAVLALVSLACWLG